VRRAARPRPLSSPGQRAAALRKRAQDQRCEAVDGTARQHRPASQRRPGPRAQTPAFQCARGPTSTQSQGCRGVERSLERCSITLSLLFKYFMTKPRINGSGNIPSHNRSAIANSQTLSLSRAH
jgi:hypothetical protein